LPRLSDADFRDDTGNPQVIKSGTFPVSVPPFFLADRWSIVVTLSAPVERRKLPVNTSSAGPMRGGIEDVQ
jgi:hypothetical protein